MGTSPTIAPNRGLGKFPKRSSRTPPRQDAAPDTKTDTAAVKLEGPFNAEAAKPLAPPPRPSQQQQQQQQQGGTDTPDYFAPQVGGSLSLEPNPFEQSFGGGGPETPGGTKLPSVAALTSPSSLLPGSNATPFNWGGGSLRTGPLSPAMLSGPANDYFSDTHHLRGGFPTPNESSLRSGLTPGGSGSMFPAPSPNSQALFAQLASGGATPSTIDFHRTALSAAAKREQAAAGHQQGQQRQAATSQQELSNGASTVKPESKPASGPFDPHDNDAANGLFMLAQGAQGRNPSQNANQYSITSAPGHAHPAPAPSQNPKTSPQMSGANAGSLDSGRGGSDGSNISDDGRPARPSTRSRGRKGPSAASGRRKADEAPVKAAPNKRTKGNSETFDDVDDASDDDGMTKEDVFKFKLTDEEKRKNFLERNRVAALKCRQRKKQWLANLQTKVEMFSSENDALTTQIAQLREEVVNLKTLLLAHKDCPITQQQGVHSSFMSQVVEPFGAQMNAYGMAGPMPNQQVMTGQGVQRRFT